MLIAIDASRAVRLQPTGTELYSRRLIEELAKLDTQNTYYLYTPIEPPRSFPELPANFHWKVIPFPRLWSHIRLSFALLQDRPDVLFVPAHVIPLYAPKNTVVTLHDFAYEIFPESYSPFARWYLRYSSRRATRKAKAILVPSQSTKQDLVKFYQASANKIYVTYLGIDVEDWQPITSIPKEIKALQPFFLMIGRLETKKNTARVIKAFGRLRQKQPDTSIKLILIGKPGQGYEAVKAAKARLSKAVAKDIIQPGYVKDKDLRNCLAAATALLYPSLYEGFGLPLLQAMAMGTPVVASDISSIPEVVGDAAILIQPESVDEIVKAMTVLLDNDLTGKQLASRGKEQVKQFSWTKTAETTLKVLKGAT